MKRQLVLATVLLLATPFAQADPIQLPDMGSSSATALSPFEEQAVGREAMKQLQQAGAMVEDPFITAYINDLGSRLALAQQDGPHPIYRFFIVNDSGINAFALPGGYIGINAGLILASRTEDEVAAVVAHEMAHVSQHHIARSVEQAGKLNAPLAAAILAGILLGRQDPQIGEAAIMGSIAGTTQSRIDFTRANEQEADRIGMQLLVGTGFDPEGMPGFFERLYQETRLNGAESSQLEFLRTHPVTLSRLADSRNRARLYPKTSIRPAQTSNYPYVKAWLEVNGTRNPGALTERLQHRLAAQPGPTTRYALALQLLHTQRTQEAGKILKGLSATETLHPAILRLRAEIARAEGNDTEAEALLSQGLSLYPNDAALAQAQARILIDEGAVERAVARIRAFIQRQPDSPWAFHLLAEAETARGRAGSAKLALAEYYYLQGNIDFAMDQLRMASKEPGVDAYELARIEAKLNEITEETAKPQ